MELVGRAMKEALETYYPLAGWRAIPALIEHKFRRNNPPIPTEVHGVGRVWLRVYTSDRYVLRQVFGGCEYDSPLEMETSVILDAGANVGYTSLFFAKRYAKATIFAIEPEASNFNLLVKNCAHRQQIVPIRGALWREPGLVGVSSPAEYEHFGVRVSAAKEGPLVRAYSVPELMQIHKLDWIDLLKLDIEGSELEVLSACDGWISKVGAVAVETHDRFKPGCHAVFERATRQFPFQFQHGEVNFAFRSDPHKCA